MSVKSQPRWYSKRGRRMSGVRNQDTMDVIKKCIANKNSDLPFFVADFSDVLYKCRYWKSKLPEVDPFYAVKCNSDPMLLRLLVSLGFRFDCASKGEIDAVLSAGAEPRDIIYAHPFKSQTFLRYAASVGVDLMTFDTEQELIKIDRNFPKARLILRIRIPDVPAAFPLSNKFGCELKEAESLLALAASLKLNVIGVSFHVGSLCMQSSAYATAIGMARQVFDLADELGFSFSILDLGGGFPGATGTFELFDEMCAHIHSSLDEHFPVGCGVRVIAEPGCYVVCSAYTLVTKIIGKRTTPDEEMCTKKLNYYINDGTYGSFGYGFEKYGYHIKPLLNKSQFESRPVYRSKLWGVSCCSSDFIVEDTLLPQMEVGEFLAFDNMGAYTRVLATNFNGFPIPQTYYVFPSQALLLNDKLQPYEKFCRDLGSKKLKAFKKLQEYITQDDSNDDLFRKG